MSRRFLYIFFLFAISLFTHLSASIPHPFELKSCMNKILQLQEAKELIAKIQKEGPFSIAINNQHRLTQKFGAFWDPCKRVIIVRCTSHSDEGSLIGSIIFEMHNALANSKLLHYDYLAASGNIRRHDYIKAIEYIEYLNSKNASFMTLKGIKSGLFPKSAFLRTYKTFKEHYSVQIKAGHSNQISKNYDDLISQRSCYY